MSLFSFQENAVVVQFYEDISGQNHLGETSGLRFIPLLSIRCFMVFF